jgi:predicted tellurium resistance membrane protein TerC
MDINSLIQEIIANPAYSAFVIGNLIIIESLLSVDNAAVLATMVMDLPEDQRDRALKYGIWGAYIFRGLAMLFASFLIKIWWLKPLGGLYLLWLVWDWYKGKQTSKTDDMNNPIPLQEIPKSSRFLIFQVYGLHQILVPFDYVVETSKHHKP